LQEGALVAVIGAALAFAANALSPRGLQLSRNYFPGANVTAAVSTPGTNLTGTAASRTNSPAELLAASLRQQGLQLADSNQAMQFFHDPRREQDEVIFIDARDEEHYRAGHIPGAYHFDRFHPETYITNVVQVCQIAQQIVFYCNGGDCDDSEHAAIMLRDSLNIPKEKVFVYGGGMTEWTANRLPIEIGARNSGQLTNLVNTAAGGQTGQAPRLSAPLARAEEPKQ
jgi:rhodanese-related sulfurtransferase